MAPGKYSLRADLLISVVDLFKAGNTWVHFARGNTLFDLGTDGTCLLDWAESFSLPGQHFLTQNDLLTTLPTLSKEWRITFDFYPTSYEQGGYAQILQLTTGSKSGKIGDRTPALWIHNTKGVYIATTLNGKASVGKFFSTKKPLLNEWTTVDISQTKKGSVYMFSFAINGEILWSTENSDPREFSDVEVYASSGWYNAQAGYIRGFQIENMTPGEENGYSKPEKIYLKPQC